MTKREELVEAVGGEERYNYLEASKQALVQEALQAGAEEAKQYLRNAMEYKNLLEIAELWPINDELWPMDDGCEDDGCEDDDCETDGSSLRIITDKFGCWEVLDGFPEGMHKYVQQGFADHIRHVVSLMESTDVWAANETIKREKAVIIGNVGGAAAVSMSDMLRDTLAHFGKKDCDKKNCRDSSMSEAFCKPLVLPQPADFSAEIGRAYTYLDFWRDCLRDVKRLRSDPLGYVMLSDTEIDTMVCMLSDVKTVLRDIDTDLSTNVIPAWYEAGSDLEARGVTLDV